MCTIWSNKKFKKFQTRVLNLVVGEGGGGQHNLVNNQTFELYFFNTSLTLALKRKPPRALDSYFSPIKHIFLLGKQAMTLSLITLITPAIQLRLDFEIRLDIQVQGFVQYSQIN